MIAQFMSFSLATEWQEKHDMENLLPVWYENGTAKSGKTERTRERERERERSERVSMREKNMKNH